MDLIDALKAPLTGDRPRADFERGRLAGSRCRQCRATAWPARAVCHVCGSADVGGDVFSGQGTLLTWTDVYIPVPGLPLPYVLGQVQLDDGPLILSHVRGHLADSASTPRVRLVIDRDAGVPWFWVVPETSRQDGPETGKGTN